MADGSGIDEFHSAVLKWAEALGLEDEEHDQYVEFHMDKGGYKRATTWLPPEPEEGAKGGGFMQGKKRAPARPAAQKKTPPSYFGKQG